MVLVRTSYLGFNFRLARTCFLGFKDSMARITVLGFNAFMARTQSLGFRLCVARMSLMGFKFHLARNCKTGYICTMVYINYITTGKGCQGSFHACIFELRNHNILQFRHLSEACPHHEVSFVNDLAHITFDWSGLLQIKKNCHRIMQCWHVVYATQMFNFPTFRAGSSYVYVSHVLFSF